MRMTMTAATITAALAVLTLAGTASPAAAGVTLIRGSFVETVPTGHSAAPVVLHGARALPAAAVSPAAPPAPVEAAAPARVVTGGDVLWRVDEATHDVQACWLQGTGAPGGYAIRCTTR